MKPESLKELKDALSWLENIRDNEETKSSVEFAIKAINHAIYYETPKPKGKFDLRKWCSDDQLIPVMNGIYHDEGFQIASDGHVLCCIKADYDAELEHKIIGDNGDEIDGRYPNYKSVRGTDYKLEYKIDTEKVYDALRQYKAAKKAAGKWGDVPMCMIKVGNKKNGYSYFNVVVMAVFCTFMDHKNNNVLRVQDPNRAAECTCEDGSWALLMPVVHDDDEVDNGRIVVDATIE